MEQDRQESPDYRHLILTAIAAFLEGTPATRTQATDCIERCYHSFTENPSNIITLDEIIWGSYVRLLGDTAINQNNAILSDMQAILSGQDAKETQTRLFLDDYRLAFSTSEQEWYDKLEELIAFLQHIPFKQIYQDAQEIRDSKRYQKTLAATYPAAAQAQQAEDIYQQIKRELETITSHNPLPQQRGKETIHHIALQEVTNQLTQLRIGPAAIFFGYPSYHGSRAYYGSDLPIDDTPLDATEDIQWAQKILAALAGKGMIRLSWRLSYDITQNKEFLLISFR